jgi:hypothetical protein
VPFHQKNLGGGGNLDALLLPRPSVLGSSDDASRDMATNDATIGRRSQKRVELALCADMLERLEGTKRKSFSS